MAALGAAFTQRSSLSILPSNRQRCQRMLHTHRNLKSIIAVGATAQHVGFCYTGVCKPSFAALSAPSLLSSFLHDCAHGLTLVTQLDLHDVTGLSSGCAAAIALHLPRLSSLSLRYNCTTLQTERGAHAHPHPSNVGFFAHLKGLSRLTKLDVGGMRPSQQELNNISSLIHLEELSLWLERHNGSRVLHLMSLVNLHTLAITLYSRRQEAAEDDVVFLASRLPHLTNLSCGNALRQLPSWHSLQGSTSLTALDVNALPGRLPAGLPAVLLPALRSLRVSYVYLAGMGAFFQTVQMPGLRVLHADIDAGGCSEAVIRAELSGLMLQVPLVGEVAVRSWAEGDGPMQLIEALPAHQPHVRLLPGF